MGREGDWEAALASERRARVIAHSTEFREQVVQVAGTANRGLVFAGGVGLGLDGEGAFAVADSV
ncbi:MAG: hypothetical protein OXN89_01745 [Bryobacterales bacterium]|nr:hypothetical protein [Bryobacterales bacterium]